MTAFCLLPGIQHNPASPISAMMRVLIKGLKGLKITLKCGTLQINLQYIQQALDFLPNLKMLVKATLISLLFLSVLYTETLASSNANSDNRAKADNSNSETIVVGGGGGGGYIPRCDNGGLFGITSRYFVGGGCGYGK